MLHENGVEKKKIVTHFKFLTTENRTQAFLDTFHIEIAKTNSQTVILTDISYNTKSPRTLILDFHNS